MAMAGTDTNCNTYVCEQSKSFSASADSISAILLTHRKDTSSKWLLGYSYSDVTSIRRFQLSCHRRFLH